MFLIAFLLLVSLIIVIFYYYRTAPPISNSFRIMLSIFRFIAILIVLLLLFFPILNFSYKKQISPITAIMVDNSLSMQQKIDNNVSKQEKVNQWLENIKKSFYKKNIKFKIDLFSDGLQGDSLRTDIIKSIAQVQEKYKTENLSDIVLLSDGLNHNNNNYELLKELNIPVSVVFLSPKYQAKDVEIAKVNVNTPLYLNKKTEIGISLDCKNVNEPLTISLWKGKRKLTEKTIKKGVQEILLDYLPTKIGIYKLKVKVNPIQGESNTLNNEREFLVNVSNEKAKILVIASQPSWDTSFLIKTINKNDNFSYTLAIKRKDGYYIENKKSQLTQEIIQHNLIIIINHTKLGFSSSIVKEIENYLTRGNNLIYIGKIDNSVAKFLPLKQSQISGTFPQKIMPTINVLNYHTFMLSESEVVNRKIWESIPPVRTYYYLCKKGATVLIEADNQERNPIIAVSNYENSQILMFALHNLWRWQMWEKDTEYYEQFFNSVINWLINTKANQRFKIITDKPQYLIGEDVQFSATLLDERLNPIRNQNIKLNIYGDKLQKSFYLKEDKEGEYTYKFMERLGQGKYTYQAIYKSVSKQMISKGEFIVQELGLEYASSGLNNNFLRFIAEQTDGKVISLENDLTNLADIDRNPDEKIIIKEIKLWRKWYIPSLFILLFCTELFIRKKKGLL